jgi:hypothetical protein
MTYQIHDKLILSGEPASMATFPDIPRDHPRILEGFHTEPPYESFVTSTACYRGYIGFWEIRDGLLFLTKIIGGFEIKGSQPVQATWFSGRLVIPQGKIIEGDPCFGWDVVRERDLVIKIRKGRVVKQWMRVNCPGFFRRQFSRIPVIGKLVLKSQGQP